MDLSTMQLIDPVDGIAELRLVRQDGQPNSFSSEVVADLAEITDHLFQVSGDLRGVLVTATGSSWMGNLSLNEARRIQGRDDSTPLNWARSGTKALNDFQDLEIPTVAVIQGGVYGCGLDFALCMNARVTLATVRMGFSEQDYGFIPGLMGPWRMAALAGLRRSIMWARTGGQFSAKAAQEMNLVNGIATPQTLREMGVEMIEAFLQPGVLLEHKRRTILLPPEDRPPEIAKESQFAKDEVRRAEQEFKPAPTEIISLLEDTVFLKRDRATEPWCERFALVARTTAADALMSMVPAFDSAHMTAVKADRALGPLPIVGLIIGSDADGRVAGQLALRGKVLLLGDSPHSASKARQSAEDHLQLALKQGVLPAAEFQQALQNLVDVGSPDALDTCNVNLDLRIATSAPKVLGKSLWIGDMPDHRVFERDGMMSKLVGMSVMPWRGAPAALLTYGPKVNANALYVSIAMAHRMGYKPVPVKHTPAGMVYRILMAGVVAYANLIHHGTSYSKIDQDMRRHGWRLGLGQMLDLIGPAAALYRLNLLREACPDRFNLDFLKPVEKLLSSGLKFYGSGPMGERVPVVDEAARELLKGLRTGSDLEGRTDENVTFIVNTMVFEATRCLDLVKHASILDFACVLSGLFPQHRGGPLKAIETAGFDNLINWRDLLVRRRPEMAPMLVKSAYIEERFKSESRAA